MFLLLFKLQSLLARAMTRARSVDDRGQTVPEYALVLLGAATIALLVLTWASGTGKISDLLDTVIKSVVSKIL